jgi:hypothetical protein
LGGASGSCPGELDPIFVPKRRAAGWYLRCDLGPRGVATRGLPRGAWEVPAGEALGASPPQHVRSMCLLLPQSLGGAEVPLGLARLASGVGASMGAGRDEQLRRGPPSGVGTIRGGDQSGHGMRWASGERAAFWSGYHQGWEPILGTGCGGHRVRAMWWLRTQRGIAGPGRGCTGPGWERAGLGREK